MDDFSSTCNSDDACAPVGDVNEIPFGSDPTQYGWDVWSGHGFPEENGYEQVPNPSYDPSSLLGDRFYGPDPLAAAAAATLMIGGDGGGGAGAAGGGVVLASLTVTAPRATRCGVSAASLNRYLSGKGSPMAGSGAGLFGAGQAYNLDPRLLVALAGAETGFGTNITNGRYNAWNWGHKSFASFSIGANVVASGLVRLYGLPGANFATGYLAKYCTTGNTCPAGLNNMGSFMAEQGGSMGSLGFPC